jgi:SAM-dependent methyltransferase
MANNLPTSRFPAHYFDRYDESLDDLFYVQPRKVVHIDEYAIRQLSALLGEILPASATLLDLMSSWRSHLPAALKPQRVVGLGMNAEEMRENPQLNKFVVQNLNENPLLPFDDAVFNGAICTVSVQYLQQPVQVFAEVQRVLQPNSPFVVSFSNRCFPTKAVTIWTNTDDRQHLALVTSYFEDAGGWDAITARQFTQRGSDPLYVVYATKT